MGILSEAIKMHLNQGVGTDAEMKTFGVMVRSFVVFLAMDILWILVNTQFIRVPFWVAAGMEIINVTMVIQISLFWFQYTVLRVGLKFANDRWFRVAASIPFMTVFMLDVISVWTGWLYRIEDGTVIYGPLYSMHFIISYVYLVFVMGLSIWHFKRTKSADMKREAVATVIAGFFIFLCGMIDILVPHTPSVAIGIFFAIVFMFLQAQQSKIYYDALTGLHNRRRFDEYLLDQMHNITESNPMHLYLFDVDYFKRINDTYGHAEGDLALRTIGRAMRKLGRETPIFSARWGGDEFVVMVFGYSEMSAERLKKRIGEIVLEECRKQGLRYDLYVSVGMHKNTRQDLGMKELLALVDEDLYQIKEARHKNGVA